MAIFHLSHTFLKRSNGASSVAKAAYNAGQKIEDNTGSTEFSDYTRKGGVLERGIMLPADSPPWANDRGELWRRLEAREDKSTRRSQAILAHNIDVALPHELTLEQNIFLMKDFVREQFTRKGYAVDWSIHAPDPRGDNRNYHAHILLPLRKIEGDGFGKKDRYTKQQLSQKVTDLRRSWAALVNRHLKRYGHTARIDDRSLRAQGVKRGPTRHKGVRARVKGASFNGMRPTYPRSPVVKMTKTTGADGNISIRAVIKHSALNNIGTGNKPLAPPIQPIRKGWPLEAVAAWESWGHKNPSLFFRIWSELAPPGFTFGGGPKP
jgi:hypothetical protein